jgi:hypothetical protein
MPPDRTPHSPAIPLVCTDRPLAGGLVVPWITLIHNGHPILGVVDERRRRAALTHGLCQICGQPLHDRAYLLVRPQDLRTGHVTEPALHPICLRYSERACPMLDGRMRQHRTSWALATHPAGRVCDTPSCPCHHTAAGPSADHQVGPAARQTTGTPG